MEPKQTSQQIVDRQITQQTAYITIQPSAQLVLRFKSFSRVISLIVPFCGILVLMAWAFDISAFKSICCNYVTMKASTAICFVLAGISLWLLQEKKQSTSTSIPTKCTTRSNRGARLLAHLCAATVALIGLLMLGEYMFGWLTSIITSIEHLFWKEAADAAANTALLVSHLEKMSPNVAINFALTGIALLLLDVENRWGYRPSQWLALIEGFISFAALLGYIYNIQVLYGPMANPNAAMALHSSILFNILFCGLLFSRPDKGFMAIAACNSTGGVLLRRLLPVVIVAPIIIGWLCMLGERSHLYTEGFNIVLFVAAVIVVFVATIYHTSRLLHLMDAVRKNAEDEAIQAKQTAEKAGQAKNEFLASMSHELRTPLNAIIGFSSIMQEETFGPLNTKQKEQINWILTSGKLLLSLINDVLDIAKIEAGNDIELIYTSCDLEELLKQSIILVKEKALQNAITLSVDVAPDVTTIAVDARRIKQVVFNLLSNAVKFTPTGGKVGIRARKIDDEMVEVTIWDTGIGISQDDQKKLFGQFIQLGELYTRQDKGMGLGLYLAQKIIKLHGGKIRIASEGQNKGSAFIFTLPIDHAFTF
jgi:signal transduction histidine kinase